MAHAEDPPMHSEYMDYAEHERTYSLFIGILKWGSMAVALIVILMAIFLV